MGQPKQLLPWGDQSLIEFQIEKLLKIGNPIVVVLGANSDRIVPVIENLDVKIVFNHHWESGMGSSISAGIHGLKEDFPSAAGALITLIDQPLVTTEHLQNMSSQFHPGNQQIIVSQSSSGWKGVPTLFDRFYFDDLKKLKGEEGAKTIIQKFPDYITSVECGNQPEDMDTPESYHRMLEIRDKSNRKKT